tara:strand:- start:1167 stop:1304 length:138 start_codon:yes stop_codon:yes gene_type:complete
MKLNIVDGVVIGVHMIFWMWLMGEFEDEDDPNRLVIRSIKRNRGG